MIAGQGLAQTPLRLSAGVEQGMVDVWLVAADRLPTELQLAWLTLLDAEEVARWHRCLSSAGRDRFLIGRALLRSLLSARFGVPAQHWRFIETEFGRPVIAAPAAYRSIAFSLSHTEGLVACAVASHRRLGIDAEWLLRPLDVARVAAGLFTPTEARAVAAAEALRPAEVFYALWTLKEAYVKARSLGMAIPLDSFWFDRSSAAIRLHLSGRCPPDDPAQWRFHEIAPSPAHCVALAVTAGLDEPVELRLRRVEAASLRS